MKNWRADLRPWKLREDWGLREPKPGLQRGFPIHIISTKWDRIYIFGINIDLVDDSLLNF